MSRTVFLNVCAQLKIECLHALDFQQPQQSDIVRDAIGEIRVNEWHFLATFLFEENIFMGTGSTKKAATEHLFSRLIASKHMPVPPEKHDPTINLDDCTFIVTASKQNRSLSLQIRDRDGVITNSSPIGGVEVPRGRYESLMSLIRLLLREQPIESQN
nr:Hypothetical protein CDS [Astacus astacus]